MRVRALLFALLIVLAGCNAISGGQPPSDDRALSVRADALDSVENVSTFQYTVDGRVVATNGEETRSLSIAGQGRADVRQQVLATNTTAEGTTQSQYVDGYTVYTECSPPWGGWGVESMDNETAWSSHLPLDRQLTLLERSNVYWGGNRTLDGNRTALLVANPTKQTLTSLPDAGVASSRDFGGVNVENATLRVWIDTETNRPVKSTLDVEFSVQDASASTTLTTRFHSYGEPVAISVPAETQFDQHELGCPGQ